MVVLWDYLLCVQGFSIAQAPFAFASTAQLLFLYVPFLAGLRFFFVVAFLLNVLSQFFNWSVLLGHHLGLLNGL